MQYAPRTGTPVSGECPGDCPGSEQMTTRELMTNLRYHWGDVYAFSVSEGRYAATAKFGQGDVLTGDDPEELLAKIRRHYHRDPLEERSST